MTQTNPQHSSVDDELGTLLRKNMTDLLVQYTDWSQYNQPVAWNVVKDDYIADLKALIEAERQRTELATWRTIASFDSDSMLQLREHAGERIAELEAQLKERSE